MNKVRVVVPLMLGALLLGAGLGPSCRSAFPDWRVEQRGGYDELPAEGWLRFETARKDYDLGSYRLAREGFARLTLDYPEHVLSGAWLQETEFALAREEGPEGAEEQLETDLRMKYRARAEELKTPEALVLAARVETDPFAALALLRRAVRVDDECAWAHYGLAFWHARMREWSESRRALGRCFDLSPGHIEARRLEAWVLAQTGQFEFAGEALDRWIERAESSIRIPPDRVREARVELALISALQGTPSRTLRLLDAIERERDPTLDLLEGIDASQERARHFALRAAALGQVDRPREALQAAQTAVLERPGDVLPRIQLALLYELWLGDPNEALAQWEKVLELTDADAEVSGAIERARASVHAERLRRSLESPEEGAAALLEPSEAEALKRP